MMASKQSKTTVQKVETEEERILRECSEAEDRHRLAAARATAFMIDELDRASERQNAAADRAAAFLAQLEGKPKISEAVSVMKVQHQDMDERMSKATENFALKMGGRPNRQPVAAQ